ncbi:MAG: DUF4912 domain-containing protein [Clostridia bacterium]|nr:DUF4912 domain-containing protein [Clostridia bacterium]
MKQTNDKKNKPLFSKLSSKNTTEKTTKKQQTSSTKLTNKTISSKSNDIETNSNLDAILNINEKAIPVEYYDLPYRYNQTVIKVLAQTPNALYIYWDISDSDRNMMKEKYGENFFNETKPVLLVHNKTHNYSFEVEIDDFANSWYLRTPTSNCVFNIQLGRKKIANNNSIIDNNIIHITSSNTIEMPNDKFLTESLNKPIYFKNIKTNELEEKDFSNSTLFKNIINKFELYNDEFINNPSSNSKI